VFAFHEDPGNLARIQGGSFRLLRHDGGIAPGCETWVRVRIAGLLPVTMGFRHGPLDAPRSFEETMIRGPFRRFHHVHEFEDRGDATLVRDRVEIALPWYLGGALATPPVAAAIARMFRRRGEALERLAGEGFPEA
jgi:ligand-binding SRPBCC domain-containing protein